MANSPAPARFPGRDRAGSRPSRRRSRWAIWVLLLAVASLAIATPAFAATHATRTTQTARTVTLTAAITPAAPGQPGGVCQVPGIGDIGGLVGLCTQGSSGLVGSLNNICQPALPQPEQATGGIDAMVEPPAAAAGGKTLYDNYGVAGQFWAAHGLQCSDMTSLIGNNVAGMVFDAAKSIDRVTITVYQSAAGNNILTWLQDDVDKLIGALGKAIYFPFLAPVVILGAIWLAWQGLIRKRATRTIEGTLWMVVAATAAIALIGKPAMFTGVGTTVSNGVTGVLNTAFSKLPAPASSNCLPVQTGDPQSVTGDFAYTSGNALVDENANELWSVLVCKPWLYGELGTTAYAAGNAAPTVVNTYGRQLLWAQAIAANETPGTSLIQAKQDIYSGIATHMQQNDPSVYPLFQGNQWTTRLEIAFAAMFAALVAGLLILLIALTLIVLKLGFLLLLVAGPFFLIIGTHPGFGRVIAIRWFEMLVGVLMKQVAIAIVLSVLLYCYSLIMGTSEQALPWALKILMITLVTAAVFIYRRPFSHLFSAVGYGTLGSTERAEYSLREAGVTFRRSTLGAATVAIPGVAGYRAARWARRNAGAGPADGATVDTTGIAAAGAGAGASRLRPDAPPVADGEVGQGSRRVVSGAGAARVRNAAEADNGAARVAPPLDLPPRANGSGRSNGSAGRAGPTGRRAWSGRPPAGPAAPGARRRATARGPGPRPRGPPRSGAGPGPRGPGRPGRRATGRPRGPGSGPLAGRGRSRIPRRPRTPRTRGPRCPEPARANRAPCRSGCARYGGTSSGRAGVDLSPGQQKAVFVLIVVVLAALGYWLILPKVTHSHPQAAPSAASSPAAAPASQPAPPPAQTASPAVTGSGAVDIYSWLPFTQQGLAAAAAVAVKFCADYNTYSWTENAAAYVATMNGLITGQLADSLRTAYNTPGVATIRTGQQQVSTGTAVIDSLRSFGPSSLTFVVTGTQHLVSSKGTSNGTAQYAITVTGSGTSWQVDNIELSTVGQS